MCDSAAICNFYVGIYYDNANVTNNGLKASKISHLFIMTHKKTVFSNNFQCFEI